MERAFQASGGRLMKKKRACPLCGRSEYETLFVKEGFLFVRCRECQLVYVPEVLTDNIHFQDDFYDERELAEVEPLSDRSVRGERMNRLIREIQRVYGARKDLRILDVGCGKGWHLDFLRSKGYPKVRGLEVTKHAIEAVKARGLEIDKGLLEEQAYPEGFWDVIYTDQVVEHLEEPQRVLKEIYRVLKKGGIFWLSVPNTNAWHIRWILKHRHRHFEGARHLNHYTCETLGSSLEAAGFRVEKTKTYIEEMTLQRLKGVLLRPEVFDTAAIRDYKTEALKGAPTAPKNLFFKKILNRAAEPFNFPLIWLTRWRKGGAYIEMVGRK